MEGEGQRIPTHKLRQTIKDSDSLRDLLLKYAYAFSVQTAHTAIANARKAG